MKATLEFTLPDERQEFQDATEGQWWKQVVWDIDQYLRGQMKYGDLPEPIAAAVQRVRDELRSYVEQSGLNLEV